MLHCTEITGILKKSQDSYFTGLSFGGSGPTLADLVQHILIDRGLTDQERQELLQQIQMFVRGAAGTTPLSSLMSGGLGGILGQQIGKYFGMGLVGQLLSSAAGFGLGRTVYDKLNAPADPYRGYKLIH